MPDIIIILINTDKKISVLFKFTKSLKKWRILDLSFRPKTY